MRVDQIVRNILLMLFNTQYPTTCVNYNFVSETIAIEQWMLLSGAEIDTVSPLCKFIPSNFSEINLRIIGS